MTRKTVLLMTGGLCLAFLAGCGTYGYEQDRYSSREGWRIEEPREMVMMPSSRVYYVPNVSVDIFFYNNSWWSRRGDTWYRGTSHNGPWRPAQRFSVPAPVYQVPGNYRSVYDKEQHIPYGQFKKQWEENDRRDNRPDDRKGKGDGRRD